MAAHASGRRSGDQFCVYVCDRLVLQTLSQNDIGRVSAGELSLDALTREFIHSHLSFRFVVTLDGGEALKVEHQVRAGDLGTRPLLNPL